MACIINSLTGVPALHVSLNSSHQNEPFIANRFEFAVHLVVKNLKIHFRDEKNCAKHSGCFISGNYWAFEFMFSEASK